MFCNEDKEKHSRYRKIKTLGNRNEGLVGVQHEIPDVSKQRKEISTGILKHVTEKPLRPALSPSIKYL